MTVYAYEVKWSPEDGFRVISLHNTKELAGKAMAERRNVIDAEDDRVVEWEVEK